MTLQALQMTLFYFQQKICTILNRHWSKIYYLFFYYKKIYLHVADYDAFQEESFIYQTLFYKLFFSQYGIIEWKRGRANYGKLWREYASNSSLIWSSWISDRIFSHVNIFSNLFKKQYLIRILLWANEQLRFPVFFLFLVRKQSTKLGVFGKFLYKLI